METTIVDSHKRPVRDTHPLWARCLAGLLIVALQLAPLKATFDQVAGLRLTLAAAHAAPIADPFAPIQFRPTLNQSSAGVPVVNITAPNAAGMSRNQFERFDVGAVGLILNNSLAGGGTLLGGQVGANPNFSGRAASLVLNEVTSTGSAFASHLAGPIELFGFPAALVIANPNGITCTGCGFINTPQATLTTGVPQFLNAPGGALSSFESATALGFDVQQERIAIEDAGLDATGSRVDLFAESIVVNAPIRANLAHGTLNLVAGRNYVVGAADGALELSANRAIQAASAGYAIDGTAFGAMSAGSIKIVATPEGLGVKTDGALAAASGSLTISANGELRVANAYARSDVDLSARGDANASGTLASNGDLRIEAMGDLSASELSAGDAELSAAGALRVNKMTVRGALAAQAGGDLELTGEASIARNATLNAGGTLSNVGIVATSGVLDLRAARLVNRGTLYGESAALAAAELDNAGGRLLAETDLRLTAGAMTNTAGLVAARADVRLSVSGAFDNAAGSLLAQRDLALSVPNAVLDSATGTLAAGNLLAIEALSLASSGAWTPHARHLTLNLQSDFAHSGTLELAGDLSVSTAGSVANSGRLSAGGTVELAGASVTNSGSLAANEDLELRGALTNRGTMAALRDVRIMGASFDNTSASVQADRNLSIDLAGTLENTGGSLTALGNTEIRASAVLNDRTAPGAQITVTRGHNPALLDTLVLIPEATSYDPGCPDCAPLTTPAVTLKDLNPDYASRTVSVNGVTLALPHTVETEYSQSHGTPGRILAAGNLKVEAAWAISNRGGEIFSGGDLSLSAANLDQGASAALTANSSETVDPAELEAFVSALIQASGNSSYSATPIATTATSTTPGITGSAQSGANAELNVLSLTQEGTLSAAGNLSISSQSALVNRGTTAAGVDLTLTASSVTNPQGAKLLAGRDVSVATGGALTNEAGIIEAGRDLVLRAATVDNRTLPPVIVYEIHDNYEAYPGCRARHGYCEAWVEQPGSAPALIAGARDVMLTAEAVRNEGSILSAGQDLTIQASSFDNASRLLIANWHGYWKEWRGSLRGWKTHHEYGSSVAGNEPAAVQAGRTLTIEAAAQSNTGIIQANSVYLGGGSLTNGLTDYRRQTPPATLPAAVISLAAPELAASLSTAQQQLASTSALSYGPPAGAPASVNAALAPAVRYLNASPAGQALAPLTPEYLLALLPKHLTDGTKLLFFADPYLEQQLLKQAALKQTGQAYFVNGLAYDDQHQVSIDTQQRATLYEAAAQFAQDHGIRLGVALSEELQAKLERPLLWYVEQEVPDRAGNTRRALVPTVYLPQASREALANLTGGRIRGEDLNLNFSETINNTGFISAGGSLSLTAQEFLNQKRSADIGKLIQGTGAHRTYLEITGDTVQPGGFVSAAKLQINAERIESISGEFQVLGRDAKDTQAKSDAFLSTLRQELRENFTERPNQDHLHTKLVSHSSGLGNLALVVVAVAVSIYTAGAASAAMASAVQAGAISATSSAALSAASGSIASSAVTGSLNGNFSFENVLESGLTAGLTAGLTQGLGLDHLDGLRNSAEGVQAVSAGAADWGTKALGWTARAGVSARVATLVNGGSFQNAFVSSLVANASASGANAIGDYTGFGQPFGEAGSAAHVTAHAALGCAAAAASGNDCASAAIGAATSASLTSLVANPTNVDGSPRAWTDSERALITSGSMLAAGLVAHGAGTDSLAAAEAARNETQNNRLLHFVSDLDLQVWAKRKAQESNGQFSERELYEAARFVYRNDQWKDLQKFDTAEAAARAEVPVVAAQDPKSGRTIYVERISPSLAAEEFTRASLAKEGGQYRDELSLASVETSQALMAGGAFTTLRKPAGTSESLTRKAEAPRTQPSLVDGEMAGFGTRPVIPASNEEILALGKGPLAQNYARSLVSSTVVDSQEAAFVIGRQPDVANFVGSSGHSTLNVHGRDWNIELNDAWMFAGIDLRRSFLLATEPSFSHLTRRVEQLDGTFRHEPTVYFRELQILRDAGYSRQGDLLVPPPIK